MIAITPDNISLEVINASNQKPVFLDFWAPWCKPCLRLMGHISELESKWESSFKFCKVNVDEYTDLALDWHIRGVPTVKIMVQGRVFAEFFEAYTPVQLNRYLTKIKEELYLLNIYPSQNVSKNVKSTSFFASEFDQGLLSLGELLHLTKWSILFDGEHTNTYLAQLESSDEYLADILYLKDVLQFVQIDFSSDPIQRKLWAAKNAFMKLDYDATMQFLIQAYGITTPDTKELVTNYLFAITQFLGDTHRIIHQYRMSLEKILN